MHEMGTRDPEPVGEARAMPADRTGASPAPRRRVTALTLAWRKFRQHKLAVASLAVLVLIYVAVLFAEFFAPYQPAESSMRVFMPPQRVHFIDSEGQLHLRPFVYGMVRTTVDFRDLYTEDTSKIYPIRFLVQRPRAQFGPGSRTMQRKLFGVEEGYLHLFGTDYRGRDVFSRVLHGGRTSLSVGLLAVALSMVLGTIIGIASGYIGGATDMVIQRLIEIISSIPTLPLWMALAAVVPPQWPSTLVFWGITTVLAFIGWTGLARQVRGMVLSVRERDFIKASFAGGGSARFIMRRHVFPNVLSHLIVVSTMRLPGMILGESALSFLGLGIKPPMTSWGLMIQDMQNLHAILQAPWIMIPGFCIILTVSAFNLFGDGLRDAADPYS